MLLPLVKCMSSSVSATPISQLAPLCFLVSAQVGAFLLAIGLQDGGAASAWVLFALLLTILVLCTVLLSLLQFGPDRVRATLRHYLSFCNRVPVVEAR